MTYIAKLYDGRMTVYRVLGTAEVPTDSAPINVVWMRTVSGYGHPSSGVGRIRTIRESELRTSSMWKAVEL